MPKLRVWIASERLPEIGGLYHVKYQAKHFDNFVSSKGTARLHDGNWLFNANHKSENIIELEWLEESPSTIDARQKNEL